MYNKTNQQKNIATILKQPKSQLANVVDKVNQLQSLNQYLRTQLDPQILLHCHIANLRDNTLILFANNAAWATKIRYMSSEILKIVKKNKQFNTIQKIQCSVRPSPQKK